MCIKNCDGTLYQLSGDFTFFDPLTRENELFNQYYAESIRIGGSPLYYSELLVQKQTTDKLYLEDRGKIFLDPPILLYCTYQPIPSSFNQGVFGIDSPDDIVFELSLTDTLNRIGHMPLIGSRL